MVAFSNLELKLGLLFQTLTELNRTDVCLAILEAMRFRDKAGVVNKLVKMKVTSATKLTAWNGLKPTDSASGIKGIYGHLIKAGEKRNQIAHATAGNFSSEKITKVRLVPNLSNDEVNLGITELIDRASYFTEVAKMLDWFIWADAVVQAHPGKVPPQIEFPVPDLVRPLLPNGTQTSTSSR